MKKLLLSSLILFGWYASAQVNVTASAGTTVATYTTLKAAFDAINAGTHQGAVTLNITANTTETATAVLNAGTTYTSVMIKPAAAATVSGAIASNALVKILGSNVTIDGSITGGTTRDLTFTNTSTTNPSVLFMGSSTSTSPLTNVTVKNSILIGNSVYTNFAIANGATDPGHFSNITVQNNDIRAGFNGLLVLADTATATNGNNLLITGNTLGGGIAQSGINISGIGGTATISNNTISVERTTSGTLTSPAPGVGINLGTGTNNATVTGNTISVKSTPTSGYNYAYGIGILPGATNVSTLVSNNIIKEINGYLTYANTCGIYLGAATPNAKIHSNKIYGLKNTRESAIQGILLASSSTAANALVYNNLISDIQSTNTGQVNAINVFAGAGYKIYSNTINLNSSNAETGISTAFYVNTNITAAGAIDLRNNILANNKTSGTRYAIYSSVANTVFSNINYNDYYTTGTALGYIGSADKVTLADVQTGFGGNMNSLNISPVFVSQIDLNLSPTANAGLDNMAVSLPEVTVDFAGNPRGATPDMGGYEFTSTALSVSDIDKNDAEISVYPNPFADILKISDIQGIKSIHIIDASGRNLKTLAPDSEINLGDLKAGLYIVSFQFEDGSVQTKKVIKK